MSRKILVRRLGPEGHIDQLLPVDEAFDILSEDLLTSLLYVPPAESGEGFMIRDEAHLRSVIWRVEEVIVLPMVRGG